MDKLKISCCICSQFERYNTLSMVIKQIENQTYIKYITDIIIVEGSKDKMYADMNKINIQSLIKEHKNLNIKYVEYDGNQVLGQLRNKMLDNSTGDYIILFDDDDYYPPTRVEHNVTELMKSKLSIGGCKGVLIFDYHLGKLFMTDENPSFASNGTIAMKREYLKDHRYRDTDAVGEELHFLDYYRNPIVQFDPFQTVFMNSHSINCYNKREILSLASVGLHQYIKPYKDEGRGRIIPDDIFMKYCDIYIKPEVSVYDVVYVCGFISVQWSPEDENITGSEQAVKFLSESFVRMGLRVGVYGSIKKTITHNGVDYYPMNLFNYQHKYKNMIIWRDCGLIATLPFNINADRVILDLHDNPKLSPFFKIHQVLINKINVICLKSKFHLDDYINNLSFNSEEKKQILGHCFVQENGIMDKFANYTLSEVYGVRNNLRFIYASCYTRGLIFIIKNIWPHILKYNEKAELHLYYGHDNTNEEFKKEFSEALLTTKNIMDHGRVTHEEIISAKSKSGYHLYISDSDLETDCITLKESARLGCIPIISNCKVFEERAGIHMNINFQSQTDINNIGNYVVEVVKVLNNDRDKKREIMEQLYNSPHCSWEKVATEWRKLFIN